MLPEDLDQIELGTVRRQIEQECLVFHEPAVQRGLIDAVMDARVVEHDPGGAAFSLPDQRVEKADNVGTLDRAGARGIDEAVVGEVQRGTHVAPAMMVWLVGSEKATW